MAIICHCQVVRERTVQKAIRRGAATLEELQAECGAAIRCGGCTQAVLDMLAEHAEPTERYESIVAVAL